VRTGAAAVELAALDESQQPRLHSSGNSPISSRNSVPPLAA
jgi:hypothetical protein